MLNFDTAFIVQIIKSILLAAVFYLVYALLFKYPKRNMKRFESIEKRIEDIEKKL